MRLWQFVRSVGIFHWAVLFKGPFILCFICTMSFNLAQAEEIVDDFEDLKDTEFAVHGASYIIEDVIVVPLETDMFLSFFDQYTIARNAAELLASYDVALFDVILVVSPLPDESSLSYLTIKQYVSDLGVGYNFPE
jgi:hypothetical protein